MRYQAIEIFTKDKKSYFFNLITEEICDQFLAALTLVLKKDKHKIVSNCRKAFERNGYRDVSV